MAILLGAMTGAVGSLSLLGYMIDLAGPIDGVLISLARVAQWAFLAWVAAFASRRLRPSVGVFVFPSFVAGLEVVVAAASPHGSAGSLAYSQLDVLPLIQVASLGGVAAVAFVPALGAAVAAYALSHRPRAWRPLIAPAVILALVFGFGVWRLAQHSEVEDTTIALVSSDQFAGVPDSWREVWDVYGPAVEQAAADGAHLVVLPEKIFRLGQDERDPFVQLAGDLAKEHDIDLIVGVDERDGALTSDTGDNRAYLFSPGGEVSSYDKRHLVPGLEASFRPGDHDGIVEASGTVYALAICKDMDFAGTIRGYGGADATLMLVPAWDFGDDAWFHSRIAVLRGVETGIPVARSARDGLLTLSDANGRIAAEVASADAVQVLLAAVPAAGAETLYTSIGDTFGWTVLFGGGAALVFLRRRTGADSTGPA